MYQSMYHYSEGAFQSVHAILNNPKQTETDKKGDLIFLR